jgi:hypothetical protein
MAPMTTPRMSRQALEQTPEFKRLSAKARFYVQNHVATYEAFGEPDVIFSTQSAYGNSGENARKMSYAVVKNKKVAACLKVWKDSAKTAREIIAEDLGQRIAAAKEGSAKRSKLIALYSAFEFDGKIPSPPAKKTTKGKQNAK